ncbi:MAG: hypothetical protein RR425_02355 [Erysipelotrichales bacterium]
MRVKDYYVQGKKNLEKNWLVVILSYILMSFSAIISIFVVAIVFSLIIPIDNLGIINKDSALSIILHIISLMIIVYASIVCYAVFQVGYKYSILDIKDGGSFKKDAFFNVFNYNFTKTLALVSKMVIYIFLYSLLFIIPGIIKSIEYSQAVYILKDNPEFTTKECLLESKRIMQNKKGKYFKILLVPIIIYMMIELISIPLHGGFSQYMEAGQQDGFNKVNAISTSITILVMVFLEPLLISIYAIFYRKLVPYKKDVEERI